MRFLFHWQHLTPDTRGTGRDASRPWSNSSRARGRGERLGRRAAARAAHRLHGGRPRRAVPLGQLVWTRIGAPARAATPVKTTPIVLLPRHLSAWQALRDPDAQPALSTRAPRRYATPSPRMARCSSMRCSTTHMLPVELEQALGGRVGRPRECGQLRGHACAVEARRQAQRDHAPRTRRGGALIGGMDDAGRWALVQRHAPPDDAPVPNAL